MVILLQKTNFCLSIVGLSLLGSAKKNFFSNFECYDLTIGEALELKFGVHVHQQVRFKILQLHTSKKLPYLCNPPCIGEVLF